MKKLLVYSHDTFGLGNIRRMLAICEYLIEAIPELSILLITGSPVIHSLRLPQRLDYIKLPCLTRYEREGYSARFIGTDIGVTMKLRADLILAAVANFRPELVLTDKKPLGIRNELLPTFRFMREFLPETKSMLVLRDILDTPAATISNWERHDHHSAVRSFYDGVLVLGEREVFDLVSEYRVPNSWQELVEFCGYVRKAPGTRTSDVVRQELNLQAHEQLVLVTPGGGQDGYAIIDNYLHGLRSAPPAAHVRSLIISGPEMPEPQKAELQQRAAAFPGVAFREFTSDPLSYLNAADVVISMGGYNTVCEILSLHKRAIVIPRVRPTEEQLIRAERMSRLGLFETLHPDHLTPPTLMERLQGLLAGSEVAACWQPDLSALPRIAARVEALLQVAVSVPVAATRNNYRNVSAQIMHYAPAIAGL